MNETLLAETIGHDTTTQLWRDDDGTYRVVVMMLAEEGAEKTPPSQSPRVFKELRSTPEQARVLYNASAAKRYVPVEQAFPPQR